MADAVLSVCWKDHTTELTTVYKSLLENNFLVDCTLSAEGQSLKAHRLVLSACSPYFHMLFQEETGKHAFIIFLDTSFEILKAVIGFVYRGETQISERNLKAFLALAHSLQIKGLNAFSKDYKCKKLPCSTTQNDLQRLPGGNQDTGEVQSVCASHRNYPENFSQHHPRYSKGYPVEEVISSVPFKGYSASCEDVRSPQDHPRPFGYGEVPVDPEITMKCEPVFKEFSETRNEILNNNNNSNEPMRGTFASEVDGETSSVFVGQQVNQFPSCSGPSHENMESSVMPPSQQQLMQLSDEVSSVRHVAEGDGPLLPEILVPKSEQTDEEKCDEPMGDTGVSRNDTNKTDEGTTPVCDGNNFDQCSRPGDSPPENDLASLRRLWSRGSQDLPASLLQKKLQPNDHSGEQSVRWNVDCEASGSSHQLDVDKRAHTKRRTHACSICGAAFGNSSNLVVHTRTHTGERPFRCKVCGLAFSQKSSLVGHVRTHTGERPYSCDVCGKTFARQSTLAVHKRIHSGERSFHCDVCGKAFIYASNLAHHKRRHGEMRR